MKLEQKVSGDRSGLRHSAYVALSMVLLVGCSAGVSRTQVDRVEIVNYGLYELGAGSVEEAPDTTSGRRHKPDRAPKLLSTTDRVSRQIGTGFGYEFVVEGEPEGTPITVNVVVDHPQFQRAGSNEVSTQDSWSQKGTLGTSNWVGWRFDEEWEMAAGTWTIRVFLGPRPLVDKAFFVQ